jgi:hypothetical protein
VNRTPAQHRQQAAPRFRDFERAQERRLWWFFSLYTEREIARLPWSAVRGVL